MLDQGHFHIKKKKKLNLSSNNINRLLSTSDKDRNLQWK